MNINTIKGLLKSKTFWANIAGITLEISNQLVPLAPPGSIAMGLAIANIILRAVTHQSLAEKGAQQ